jgi:DNA replicative helicase MCM subunit Mcm2 (Cdc46/Mcm family)
MSTSSSNSHFYNFDLEQDSPFVGEDHRHIEIISVTQALRENFRSVKVKGTVIGISRLFKMISKVEFYCDYCQKFVEFDFIPPVFDTVNIEKRCDQCNKFSNKNHLNLLFKNAIILELQDTETFNDMDRLPVFLFDNYTEGIVVGETVFLYLLCIVDY